MSNSSSPEDHQGWSHLPWYIFYILQGFLIAGGNVLIIAAIGRYEALRTNKEFVLMLGLSLADAIYLAGFFFAGIYRICLLILGLHHTKVLVWHCMFLPHSLCFILGAVLCPMMLLALSADRMFCVLTPVHYITRTASYAQRLLGFVYGFNLLSSLYIALRAFSSEALVSATCVPDAIIRRTAHRPVIWAFTHLPPFYALLSVLLFGLVIVIHNRAKSNLQQHPAQMRRQLRRQRRVTVTLGISACCTFVLFVLPFWGATQLFSRSHYNAALALWCATNLNSFGNVFIYPLRHVEVKQALDAMRSCKHMPLDLRLWQSQSQANITEMQRMGAQVEDRNQEIMVHEL